MFGAEVGASVTLAGTAAAVGLPSADGVAASARLSAVFSGCGG